MSKRVGWLLTGLSLALAAGAHGQALQIDAGSEAAAKFVSTAKTAVEGLLFDGPVAVVAQPAGVEGHASAGAGVYATSFSGPGVSASSGSGRAVEAFSGSKPAVYAESFGHDGVVAKAAVAAKSGIYAVTTHASGYAGYFEGPVHVNGPISQAAGGFKIDHPLEPENRYLYHSSVESPDMMNVYNGNVVLDAHGEAWVELPAWFEALNRDFRYQLTPIGGFAPVYIAEKIAHHRFRIAGGSPGLEISWQVTGVRQDPWAEAHRIPVQEDKPEIERGTYLHPAAWGRSTDLDVQWIHRPELMAETERLSEGPE
jgi:hypothetical protein